jgi:hypothetical protein
MVNLWNNRCCLQEGVFTIVLAAMLNSTMLLLDTVIKDGLSLKNKKLLARVPSDHIQRDRINYPLNKVGNISTELLGDETVVEARVVDRVVQQPGSDDGRAGA